MYDVDLTGEWFIVGSCDSCLIYEFTDDGNLIIREPDYESIYRYKYKWFKAHTIKIFKDDGFGIHSVRTYSKDSIEIMGFTLSSIFEERNSLLKRIR